MAKSSNTVWNGAGLETQQIELLRQQYLRLRSEGRSADLAALAVRSRFVPDEAVQDDEDAQQVNPQQNIQSALPLDLCKRYSCIPVELNKGTLTLRAAQMLNAKQLERIQAGLRIHVSRIQVQPSSRHEVISAIQGLEQTGSVSGLIELLKNDGLEAGRLRGLVYAVLREAITLRASDIHLSRKSDPDAWLSYRIDSVIRPTYLLPEVLMQSLVARIKIESGMDASNSRSAQDGRLSVSFDDRVVDFRVSTQPLVDGESLVLRTLDSSTLPSLAMLFPAQPRMIELVRRVNQQSGKSGGLVFITGATGSGKSTTQYTMACGFRRDAMNVITVEDPVEYILPFAKQIQLQALIKQRAIELERSILRQDPDVLIFGEVRDADSARAALAFAESGHMVISTIHANSALQVTERFLSIIDPVHREDSEFLLAHYLRLVIHQRLVRRLCSCARECTHEELAQMQTLAAQRTGGLIQPQMGARKAQGCGRCNSTGYFGRVAAHETMHVPSDEDMRGKFIRAFRDKKIELPVDLVPEHGVEYISRVRTLEVLLNNGLVDWATVEQALGVV
ncbi:MAG TPA: ATPase, T2SS/T4P/T4SS family [Limnobacter sp.]|nr:ATPase, T2SS/T4P/T4SS family [Limnobacter sp.]